MSTHTDASVGDETPMVARVNYSRESAGNLVQYIEQGAARGLRNETGRRLSSEDRDRFVARSEQRGFTRSVVLSVPDHAEANLSDRSMERETRRVMNEQLRDAPSARYVYGVHEDTDHRHAHVAITGNEYDLTWDRDDLVRPFAEAIEIVTIPGQIVLVASDRNVGMPVVGVLVDPIDIAGTRRVP